MHRHKKSDDRQIERHYYITPLYAVCDWTKKKETKEKKKEASLLIQQ